MNTLEQAIAYHRAGKLVEAENVYQEILISEPTHADALRLLALIYSSTHRDQQAEKLLLKVTALYGNFTDAHIDLGNLYLKYQHLEKALHYFNQALKSDQNNAMAHYNLGFVYQQQQNYQQAIAHYQQAISLNPNYINAYNNLGNIYQKLGENTRALPLYCNANKLNSEDLTTQYNLARCYQVLEQLPAAIALYENILKQQPQFIDAYLNLAALYETRQQVAETLQCLLTAQQVQPHNKAVLCKLASAKLHVCDWENLDALLQLREQLVRDHQQTADISPFSFMLHCDSPALQQQCAQQWSQHHYAHFAEQRKSPRWEFPQKKFKIGYLSADFHHHPSAFIAAELFELHDRAHFEIHAYSYGPDDHSAIRQRIQQAADVFHDISHCSVSACAEKIYQDHMNVLIDFTGLSNRSTVEILALRPAPIQIHYLGYPGTLGTDFIDYYISDEFLIAPHYEQYYCEKILRLAFRIDDRQRLVNSKEFTRAACGLPENALVLCCHTMARKILPSHFQLWCEILTAAPETVLWLYEDNALAQKNLLHYAKQFGIAAERLIFAPRISYEDYLARLAVADLFLDTFPYNAHSTAHDALWAGVPLVTLCGETLVSRVGATLLKSMNLEQLITYDQDQYRSKILELVTHPQKLKHIKTYLLAHQAHFPLFDSAKTTRRLEQLYQQVWQDFLSHHQ